MKEHPHVVIAGNVCDGFRCLGAFSSYEDAWRWCEIKKVVAPSTHKVDNPKIMPCLPVSPSKDDLAYHIAWFKDEVIAATQAEDDKKVARLNATLANLEAMKVEWEQHDEKYKKLDA